MKEGSKETCKGMMCIREGINERVRGSNMEEMRQGGKRRTRLDKERKSER